MFCVRQNAIEDNLIRKVERLHKNVKLDSEPNKLSHCPRFVMSNERIVVRFIQSDDYSHFSPFLFAA